MFDNQIVWLLAVGAGAAAASASCILAMIPGMLPEAAAEVDDSWRDASPLVFRIARAVARRFAGRVERRLSTAQREAMLAKLDEAGLVYAVTPEEFVVLRWLLVIASVLFATLVVVGYSLYQPESLALVVALPLVAYLYVDLWLRDLSKHRKRLIEKHFPFFLDVVVLSMKAGLAFPAAVQQATAQLPNGPLRQEFARLVREVRTGVTRREGLERLARRIRLPSVSNFVAAVAQAEESGGGLSRSLNEQARQRQRERFQRAEKAANQAPVKLLFPLVAFLFPVTFIIIGFPMYEQLSKSGFF